MDNYELYHHGVKGQKWGVRRTAAQLGHSPVAKKASAVSKKVGKFAGKQAVKAKKAVTTKIKQSYKEHQERRYYEKLHKKKLSQMTDKEMNDLAKRIRAEANLKDAKYESRVQNARKFYKNVAQKPIDTATTILAKEAAKKMFGDNSKSDSGDKNKDSGGNNKKNKNDDTPQTAIEFQLGDVVNYRKLKRGGK